ncbi:MAG: N-acetyltransferase [Chloroflexi bacterium]|nr:MAG: N-acetyltransferase [Chloroflexota bacterium]
MPMPTSAPPPTVVLYGLVHFGFTHLGILRVIAHCNPENIVSWKVLEKIGMRREGHLRKNVFFHTAKDGSPIWLDTYEYAILKEDLKAA